MPYLDFKGKEFVRNHHLSVPHRPLVPDTKKSVGKSRLDGNLIIHGDNLHALKSLIPMYAGRVNCIYIDPPYNTGNEGWCYNDNVNSPQQQAWLNQNPVGIEDGFRHDKWCAMMWPRLVLLHDLLAEDGVIFISIDDNEHHHLRMMMDEIFGVNKFVGNIAWESKTKSQNTKDSFNKLQPKVEQILCYSKNLKTKVRFNLTQKGSKEYPENDDSGVFRYAPVELMSSEGTRGRETMIFPILGIHPPKGKQWKVGETTISDLQKRGDLVKIDGKPHMKLRPPDERTEKTEPFWAFVSKEIGTTESAKSDLSSILGSGHGFETVKPSALVQKLLFHATNRNSNHIILDPFAGSGTTAHATLALNKEDGGNRKFILVECEDYADKVTAERVRHVIKGVSKAKDKNLKAGLGGEFTYCELGEATDIEKLLSGEVLPRFKALGTLLFHTATNEVIDVSQIDTKTGYLGESSRYHLWLIYKPNLKYLKSNKAALTLDKAQEIADAKAGDKRHLVFAPAVFVSRKVLDDMNIPVDYQPLPWGLYKVSPS